MQIEDQINSTLARTVFRPELHQLLEKIAQHKIIELKSVNISNESGYEIIQITNEKLQLHYGEFLNQKCDENSTDLEGNLLKSWI